MWYDVRFAILEKINLSPDEVNVRTAEVLLRNAAMWNAFLHVLRIDHEEFAPRTWRKGLVPLDPSKKVLIKKAISIFPEHADRLKKSDRAEASLMAWRAMKHVDAGRPTKL